MNQSPKNTETIITSYWMNTRKQYIQDSTCMALGQWIIKECSNNLLMRDLILLQVLEIRIVKQININSNSIKLMTHIKERKLSMRMLEEKLKTFKKLSDKFCWVSLICHSKEKWKNN